MKAQRSVHMPEYFVRHSRAGRTLLETIFIDWEIATQMFREKKNAITKYLPRKKVRVRSLVSIAKTYDLKCGGRNRAH